LVAHDSQLHAVPDDFSDEAAVMVEPAACAVHAAFASDITGGERVMVLGSGTLGLCVIAAMRALCLPGALVAVAKHPNQRKLAHDLGADQVVKPGEHKRAARRLSGSLALESGDGSIERLTGGVDLIVDCVGTSASLEQCLEVVRPGGRIVLVGMPGLVRLDLAPLWQREIELRGAYAYGSEDRPEGPRSTFQLAFELVREARLERLVSARYPLERYEDAIAHAAAAGRRGAVKIVFDMRKGGSGPDAPNATAGRADTAGTTKEAM
jgi:threonine dehydrogenase-like Zn-dependent dehydrogenase